MLTADPLARLRSTIARRDGLRALTGELFKELDILTGHGIRRSAARRDQDVACVKV